MTEPSAKAPTGQRYPDGDGWTHGYGSIYSISAKGDESRGRVPGGWILHLAVVVIGIVTLVGCFGLVFIPGWEK